MNKMFVVNCLVVFCRLDFFIQKQHVSVYRRSGNYDFAEFRATCPEALGQRIYRVRICAAGFLLKLAIRQRGEEKSDDLLKAIWYLVYELDGVELADEVNEHLLAYPARDA